MNAITNIMLNILISLEQIELVLGDYIQLSNPRDA